MASWTSLMAFEIASGSRPRKAFKSMGGTTRGGGGSEQGCSLSGHMNCAALQQEQHEEEEDPTKKDRRKVVRVAWEKLVRWSRSLRSKAKTDILERTNRVVVLGGGSFGTATAAHVAGRKAQLEVNMGTAIR